MYIKFNSTARRPQFKGYTDVHLIAEKQTGPTCGFESVIRVIQFSKNIQQPTPAIMEDLWQMARRRGWLLQARRGHSLSPEAFVPLLAAYEVKAQWYHLNQFMIIDMLLMNHALLAIGDAHYLDPQTYPTPNEWHAFNLTNFVVYPDALVREYVGLDSNFHGTPRRWDALSVTSSIQRYAEAAGSACVLATDEPARWSRTARHFFCQSPGSRLIPVP